MASKREPNISESLEIFKDVCNRSLLEDFIFMNHTMISINTKEKYSVVLSIDKDLWNAIIDDKDLKSHIREYDPTIDGDDIKNLFSYMEDINNDGWINLDCDQLYAGKVMKIDINGIEYDIPVCKNLIPLKLKKNEFNNIKYKIIKRDQIALVLNKLFGYPLENSSFSISRIFYIL